MVAGDVVDLANEGSALRVNSGPGSIRDAVTVRYAHHIADPCTELSCDDEPYLRTLVFCLVWISKNPLFVWAPSQNNV